MLKGLLIGAFFYVLLLLAYIEFGPAISQLVVRVNQFTFIEPRNAHELGINILKATGILVAAFVGLDLLVTSFRRKRPPR